MKMSDIKSENDLNKDVVVTLRRDTDKSDWDIDYRSLYGELYRFETIDRYGRIVLTYQGTREWYMELFFFKEHFNIVEPKRKSLKKLMERI